MSSLRVLQKAGRSNPEKIINWIATPLLKEGARDDGYRGEAHLRDQLHTV